MHIAQIQCRLLIVTDAARPRDSRRTEALHLVCDVIYGEDACQIRTVSGRQVMATLRDLVIAILKPGGASNIAVATRRHARDATGILANPRTHPGVSRTVITPPCWGVGRPAVRMLPSGQLVLRSKRGQPGK